ncbi:hypothetical protein MBLNU459_g2763t1 [Dothideomycetes sp. NU459]
MLSRSILGSLALLASEVTAYFSYNGLANTPQMGWDNWNAFGCDVSEDLLLGTAQRMVELGLRDAGYEYVILDDCWSDGRYPNGSLKPDFTKFPNGMAHVAAQIHALGLKYGMYSDAGKYTCGQYAGSLGYETIDAQTFASWGVDYLKYDNCYNEGESGTPQISYNRYNWAHTMSNSFRMSGDIYDNFNEPDVRCPCSGDEGYDCEYPGFHCSVMNILNKQTGYPDRSRTGTWADMDMLEVGNGGQTDEEYKLHMTMWAAAKSPLVIGTDIRILSPQSLSIYLNPAVLAISQDPTGSSVVRRWRYYTTPDQYGQGEISMWSGSLAQGDYIVILLNAGLNATGMNATLADIFIDNGGAKSVQAQSEWDLYDLWANRMPNATASAILDTNSTVGVANVTSYYYNATQTSYADGIAANDTLLMGTMVGTVRALGTVAAQEER